MIGPPVRVHLFGAPVLAILPIVQPVGNVGPILCAFSYAGQFFRAGADLSMADLAGADLRSSVFLTQAQVDAANGDTLLLSRPAPAHWRGR